MDFIGVIIFISGLIVGFIASRFFSKKEDSSATDELNRLQKERDRNFQALQDLAEVIDLPDVPPSNRRL